VSTDGGIAAIDQAARASPILGQLRFFVSFAIFVVFVLKLEARRPNRLTEPPRSCVFVWVGGSIP
jgi:hypothetical protein